MPAVFDPERVLAHAVQASVFPCVDLDLQFEGGRRVRVGAIANPRCIECGATLRRHGPSQERTRRIASTVGPIGSGCTCTRSMSSEISERMSKEELVDGRSTAECQTL